MSFLRVLNNAWRSKIFHLIPMIIKRSQPTRRRFFTVIEDYEKGIVFRENQLVAAILRYDDLGMCEM